MGLQGNGGEGENGTIQFFLEENNIQYTGSDSTASKIAIDKNSTKKICIDNYLPTPQWDFLRLDKQVVNFKYLHMSKSSRRTTGVTIDRKLIIIMTPGEFLSFQIFPQYCLLKFISKQNTIFMERDSQFLNLFYPI